MLITLQLFLLLVNNNNFVTVHSVHSNALRDAQKSCIRMISRRNSRVFCELCSQKTPRGTLLVNSNTTFLNTLWNCLFSLHDFMVCDNIIFR